MLKLNDSYSIIKGWPKINDAISQNQPTVSAYVVDKERLTPFKLTHEQHVDRNTKRTEIENKIREYDKLAEEGNDTEFKKFFTLEQSIYVDIKDVPYPSVYDGDRLQEIFDAETEIVEVEIDDYLKNIVQEYFNNSAVQSHLHKTSESPIWVIKRN